jgi:hypothetical protein
MKLAELRESYPLARQVIEEWAGKGMEREVLVLRKQDGTAKMVYWNEEKGVGNVDDGECMRGGGGVGMLPC